MREFRLTIERDCEAESPRDYDNLGTLYIQRLKYHIDISDKNSRRQYWEDREDWGEGVLIPLEVIEDRQSITLNPQSLPEFDDPEGEEIFDAYAGFIYASKEKLDKEYGENWDRERVESVLLAEVETLQKWCDGEVYGYTLYERLLASEEKTEETEDTEETGWEIVDSCWGFYGDDWEKNGMREQLPIDTGSVEIEVCYN